MKDLEQLREKLVNGLYDLENKKLTSPQVYFYATLAASFYYNDILNIALNKLNVSSKPETIASNFIKLLTKETVDKILAFYKANKRKENQDKDQYNYEKSTARHLNDYKWRFFN